MVSNDDFDGKATHLNCFYLHINFEQKCPKPAIVSGKPEESGYFCLTLLKKIGFYLIPMLRSNPVILDSQFENHKTANAERNPRSRLVLYLKR